MIEVIRIPVNALVGYSSISDSLLARLNLESKRLVHVLSWSFDFYSSSYVYVVECDVDYSRYQSEYY